MSGTLSSSFNQTQREGFWMVLKFGRIEEKEKKKRKSVMGNLRKKKKE